MIDYKQAKYMDSKTSIQRVCPSCNTVFTITSAKHTFCTNLCRSRFFRRKLKERARDKDQHVVQLESDLNTIKERGVPPAKLTPPPTPAWQRANHLCEAKQALRDRLREKLDQKRQEHRAKTGPGEGFVWGLIIGVGLMLIVVSIIHKQTRRRGEEVGAPFWLISAMFIPMVGLLLARLGHWAEQGMRSPAATEMYRTQVKQLTQEVEALENELKQEESELEALRRVRDAIEDFEASPPPAAPADEEPLPPADPA